MANKDRDSLGDVARAILDGTPVDWDAAEAAVDDTGRVLTRQLRLVADIVHLHRELNPPQDAPPTPSDQNQERGVPEGIGQWGHLVLLERVGQGAFGEVYRAWDRRLEREVALKLLDNEYSETGTDVRMTDVLSEARLLARVHHRNVVSVFDAETIDGRTGVWM